jgi:hypothetical protein
MNTEKRIGKISSATFGIGGYGDAMFGLSIGFSGPGWGVGDFKGMWGPEIESRECSCWTEKDRDREYAKTMRFTADVLFKAKKSDVSKLVGTPVEVTFDGNTLKSWRVLEEAL